MPSKVQNQSPTIRHLEPVMAKGGGAVRAQTARGCTDTCLGREGFVGGRKTSKVPTQSPVSPRRIIGFESKHAEIRNSPSGVSLPRAPSRNGMSSCALGCGGKQGEDTPRHNRNSMPLPTPEHRRGRSIRPGGLASRAESGAASESQAGPKGARATNKQWWWAEVNARVRNLDNSAGVPRADERRLQNLSFHDSCTHIKLRRAEMCKKALCLFSPHPDPGEPPIDARECRYRTGLCITAIPPCRIRLFLRVRTGSSQLRAP